MRVLGAPRVNFLEVVSESGLQGVEHLGTVTSHGAEVTDIEDDRVMTTREVLSHRATRVLKRHLPATEGDDFRAEFDVKVIKIGTAIQRDSLSGSTVHNTQVVLTEELVKISLVHDEERDLGIEIAESTNLAVLLGR
jgi:hypothetical protein